MLTLAPEELGALVGVVAQRTQDGARSGEQAVLARGGSQLAETGAEDEATLQVADDQSMVLEGDGQPVGRRAGQPGCRHELGEGRRAGLEGAEHDRGLVKHPDATCVVHVLILASHCLRRTFVGHLPVRMSVDSDGARRGRPHASKS